MYLINEPFRPLETIERNDVLPFIKDNFTKDYLARYLLDHHPSSEDFQIEYQANVALYHFFDVHDMISASIIRNEVIININGLLNLIEPERQNESTLLELIKQLGFYFITTERFSYANNILVKTFMSERSPDTVIITFAFMDEPVNYVDTKPFKNRYHMPEYLTYHERIPTVSAEGAAHVVVNFSKYLQDNLTVPVPFKSEPAHRIQTVFGSHNPVEKITTRAYPFNWREFMVSGSTPLSERDQDYVNSALKNWIWLAWIHFISKYSMNYADQIRIEVLPIRLANNELKTYDIAVTYRNHPGEYSGGDLTPDYLQNYVREFGFNDSLIMRALISPIQGSTKEEILNNGRIKPSLAILGEEEEEEENYHIDSHNAAPATNLHDRRYILLGNNAIKIYKASECHFTVEGNRGSFQEVMSNLPVIVKLTAILGRDHILLNPIKITEFNATEDYIVILPIDLTSYKDAIFYLKKNGWIQRNI